MKPESVPVYAEALSVRRALGSNERWLVSVIAEPQRLQTVAADALTSPQVMHFLLLIRIPLFNAERLSSHAHAGIFGSYLVGDLDDAETLRGEGATSRC